VSRRSRWASTLIATAVFLVLLGASWSGAQAQVNRWNGLTSSTFTQTHVQIDVPAQPPCEEDDFAIMGDSDAECLDPPGQASPSYGSFVHAELDWGLSGFAGFLPPPPADVAEGFYLSLLGDRTTADTFAVEGDFGSGVLPPLGTAGVAVFRYSGDPTVFDGLEALSIYCLVNYGLIAPEDILYEATYEGDGDFAFEVDVTGLDDDEIVIFAAGTGPIPEEQDVPATSLTGLVALVCVMVGLGSRAVRRKKSGA